MPRVAIQDMKASLAGDGTTAYGQLTSAPLYAGGAYSVAFWTRAIPQSSDKTIWNEGNSGNATPLVALSSGQVAANATKLSVFVRNDAGAAQLNFVNSTRPVFDSTWHHVVWVDNNGVCVLYIDSVADATNFNYTRTGVYTLNRTGILARVRNTVGNFVTGNLRDLMGFPVALTQAQVTNLYVTSTPPSVPTYRFKCDDGTGGSLTDSSGSGNTATLTSATFISDTPTKLRQQVGGNLVRNGDFEYAPPFVAAASAASGRFVDGTAAGSTTNKLFGWAVSSAGVAATYAVRFDPTTFYSGLSSMRLSVTDATGIAIVGSAANLSAPAVDEVIPMLPNMSYTLTGRVKTTNAAANAAWLELREFTGARTTVVTNSTAKLTGTNDWTLLSVTFTTNATTRFGVVILRNGVAGNVSDVWFDDVTLRQTTVPTRTLATGRVLATNRLQVS